MTKRILLGCVATLLAGCATLDTPRAIEPLREQSAAVVAAADPRAAEAGREMLRRGGSATDAAIATMLALTVVEPQSSGIGGGGFFVRGGAAGEVTTYDGRETAPMAADGEWFLDEAGKPLPTRAATISGLSVGVPGNIALAARAHAEHGRLPWAELFEPAIRLAREGFILNPRLEASLEGQIERAGHSEAGRALFYAADGTPRPVGTAIVQPELAATLERIAAGGRDAFYAGAPAGALAAKVAAATPKPAAMTASDITGYEAKQRPPVCGFYRAYRVCGMGPPSSGGVAVIGILGQLERFDLAALGVRSPATWHLFVEAQRLAYADRELYTADSDFVPVPTAGLVDPDYLASRALLIDPETTLGDPAPGSPPGAPQALVDGSEYPESGTSHLVAIGPDGTMVSYTSTIEGAFGSGLMHDGYYLNNELTDFSFRPDADGRLVANRVEGGKRPRSSMAPMVVYDPQGRPFLAIGAAGGPTIPIQTARAIIGVIDFGLPLREALALPMIMAFGDRVMVEDGTWLEDAVPQLQALGHETVTTTDFLFRTNGAIRTADGWVAVHDPRLDPLLAMPAVP